MCSGAGRLGDFVCGSSNRELAFCAVDSLTCSAGGRLRLMIWQVLSIRAVRRGGGWVVSIASRAIVSWHLGGRLVHLRRMSLPALLIIKRGRVRPAQADEAISCGSCDRELASCGADSGNVSRFCVVRRASATEPSPGRSIGRFR